MMMVNPGKSEQIHKENNWCSVGWSTPPPNLMMMAAEISYLGVTCTHTYQNLMMMAAENL